MTPRAEIRYLLEPIGQSDVPRAERERNAILQMLEKLIGGPAVIEHTPDGAPVIPDSDIHISVSHSRNYAALAWSQLPGFGIDIEEARLSQLQQIATRFLTQKEYDIYSCRPDGLLQAWTLKEAAFKTLQTGPVDLRKYHLPLTPDNDVITVYPDKNVVEPIPIFIIESSIAAPGLFLSLTAL